MQPPIAVARLLACEGDQLLSEFGVVVRPGLIAIAAAVHFEELTGLAFAVGELLLDKRHVRSQAGKLQPFFRITALSASLSRLRSATRCFSRRFSSSKPLKRWASLTSRPPYLLFQV